MAGAFEPASVRKMARLLSSSAWSAGLLTKCLRVLHFDQFTSSIQESSNMGHMRRRSSKKEGFLMGSTPHQFATGNFWSLALVMVVSMAVFTMVMHCFYGEPWSKSLVVSMMFPVSSVGLILFCDPDTFPWRSRRK